MDFMKSKVYKWAKTFSILAKVAEFQSFIQCIASKTKKKNNKRKWKNK